MIKFEHIQIVNILYSIDETSNGIDCNDRRAPEQ